MFDRDFYPTPIEVIQQMLSTSEINEKIILEPSAGSGNIVDYLKENGAKEVIACELNDKLRLIVEDKCRIIANDFLTVTPDMVSHIDMIVMNPPFSCEEDHILHAYEIAPQGCEIISLCNSSVMRGWNVKKEKIKELVELYGSDEYLGNVFSSAERKTDVSVSVIRLYKPKTGEREFEDYFFDDAEDEHEQQGNGIITYDFVRDCVNRYTQAVKMFDTVMDSANHINSLVSVFDKYCIKFGATLRNGDVCTNIKRESFKKELQKKAWRYVFDNMKVEKYLTASVIDDLNNAIERQKEIPFTMRNIYKMVHALFATHEQRLKKSLVETFDKICSYSSENSTAGEKWKTNSHYKIRKRFIVPNICEVGYKDNVRLSYYGENKIEDLIKGLCLITGRNYDEQISLYDFVNEFNHCIQWGKWIPIGHFIYKENEKPRYVEGFLRVRFYKKGTAHFEFINDRDLDLFNLEVAKIKGWQLFK